MREVVTFSCACGRHVVCERGSETDRLRRCSRCRLRAEASSLVRPTVVPPPR